jgi:hypothetical protein
MTRRSRRRNKTWPGTVTHFPTSPGWWVQWAGRTDWQPIDEKTGRWLQKILVANGDRVVHIEPQTKMQNV